MSHHYKYIPTHKRHIKEIWNKHRDAFTGKYLVEIQRCKHKFCQTFLSIEEAQDFLYLVENKFSEVKDLGTSVEYVNKDVNLFQKIGLAFDSNPQLIIFKDGDYRTYNIPPSKVDEIYEWAKFARTQRSGKDQGRATAKRLKTVIRRGKALKNQQQTLLDD